MINLKLKEKAKAWIDKEVCCPNGSKGILKHIIQGGTNGRVEMPDGSLVVFPLKQLYPADDETPL